MSNKLNIITTSLRYPPAPGGAEKIAQEAVLRLAKKGHNLKVYTSNLKSHNLPNATWLKPWEYREDPAYIKRLPASFLGEFPYPFIKGMFGQILKEKDIDLIHAHSFYYYPLDISYFLSKIKRVPLILHPYFYYPTREALKWQIYRTILGKLTMRAECVIVLSPYAKKQITQFFSPQRIEIIPPGLNPLLRKKVSFNIFKKYNLQNKNIVLFVGRICYGKGVDVLIKSAPLVLKKHPNTVFALVGSDFGDKKDFVKLAQRLKIEDKILWLGELQGENLASVYQNATLFCLPTSYENFGIVLAEAMACGLPIVSTNCSAVPYVVPRNEAGFLTPKGNYKQTAYYINKLLDNPSLIQKMGERGKKEAQKYNWDRMANKIEEIYYSLVKNKN